ncbi:hypothetical protein BH20ACT5_BH20ACT5_15030 [soil metagenome]
MVSLAVTVGARSIVRDGGDPRLGVAVALIFLTVSAAGVAILFASLQGRPTAADFGLRRPPLLRATGLVIAVWGAVIALTIAWLVAFGIDDSPSVTDRLVADSGTLNALLVFVLVAVATPLGEEFLFRGYLFRALINWRGVWPAAIISSVVFSATHIGWSPVVVLVPAVIFGLGACALYRWTGSLYPALALHALFNCVGLGLGLGWTWQLPVAMVLSVAATCALARLIAVLLGPTRVRPKEPRAG